jgi:hypothetical protein
VGFFKVTNVTEWEVGLPLILILLCLLSPGLAVAQNLPNGFHCEDLIDFANGKASPNRSASGPARKPNPKDKYGAALLAYDIQLCRRLKRKEITVAQFNVLQAEKLRQLTSEKQKGLSAQQANTTPKRDLTEPSPPIQQSMTRGLIQDKANSGNLTGLTYQGPLAGYEGPTRPSDVPGRFVVPLMPPERANTYDPRQAIRHNAQQSDITEQQSQKATIQALRQPPGIQTRQQDAARRQLEIEHQDMQNQQAARQAAVLQAQQAAAARRQQGNQQLIQACGAKGLGVDFVTGNCVSPRGTQINPHNLYQPFTAPLPQPNSNELSIRCGALGRAPDFATGRCM